MESKIKEIDKRERKLFEDYTEISTSKDKLFSHW